MEGEDDDDDFDPGYNTPEKNCNISNCTYVHLNV